MKQQYTRHRQVRGLQGFTLIELMIVMIIMGILAAIGVTAFIASQVKGRDTSRKGDLKAVSQALEAYYNDKGQYPASDDKGNIVGCNGSVGNPPVQPPVSCPAGGLWKDVYGTIYMAQIPKDPSSKTQSFYYFGSKSAGSQIYNQYQMYTHLENKDDSQIITPTPASVVPAVIPNCGTASSTVACNYGVSSGNLQP